MNYELYFLRSSEQYLCKTLLYYAARLDESHETLDDHPYLEQYQRLFGTFNGDIGVYALMNNELAGGAWVRLLANGFGFVDHHTPELVFAVKPAFRNQGLGTKIMEQLMLEVSKVFTQMSLSVREDNPVIRLYERLGFEKVDGSERKNIAGSLSFTMLKRFDEPAPSHSSRDENLQALEAACYNKSIRPND